MTSRWVLASYDDDGFPGHYAGAAIDSDGPDTVVVVVQRHLHQRPLQLPWPPVGMLVWSVCAVDHDHVNGHDDYG